LENLYRSELASVMKYSTDSQNRFLPGSLPLLLNLSVNYRRDENGLAVRQMQLYTLFVRF